MSILRGARLGYGGPHSRKGMWVPAMSAGGGAIFSSSVRLPGASGDFVSTPDSAAVSITGDIDIRVRVALDDWTPAAESILIAKEQSGTQRSFRFVVTTGGNLLLLLSTDGSATASDTSSVATGFTDGTTHWVRATWVDSTNVSTFYTSDDGETWVELGTAGTIAIAGIFDSTSQVEIGSRFAGTLGLLVGNVYYAEVRNGIDGPVAANPNFGGHHIGVGQFIDSTGAEWTLQGNAAFVP